MGAGVPGDIDGEDGKPVTVPGAVVVGALIILPDEGDSLEPDRGGPLGEAVTLLVVLPDECDVQLNVGATVDAGAHGTRAHGVFVSVSLDFDEFVVDALVLLKVGAETGARLLMLVSGARVPMLSP